MAPRRKGTRELDQFRNKSSCPLGFFLPPSEKSSLFLSTVSTSLFFLCKLDAFIAAASMLEKKKGKIPGTDDILLGKDLESLNSAVFPETKECRERKSFVGRTNGMRRGMEVGEAWADSGASTLE